MVMEMDILKLKIPKINLSPPTQNTTPNTQAPSLHQKDKALALVQPREEAPTRLLRMPQHSLEGREARRQRRQVVVLRVVMLRVEVRVPIRIQPRSLGRMATMCLRFWTTWKESQKVGTQLRLRSIIRSSQRDMIGLERKEVLMDERRDYLCFVIREEVLHTVHRRRTTDIEMQLLKGVQILYLPPSQ
jgi:hypothetical protein